jgi:membrane associated rhomboid family serine protease
MPAVEMCYRHPTVPTRVHCTRCERPICPDCMIPAPVGHQCPECVGKARREFRQGPGRRIAVRSITATKVLLVAIVGVFVLELVGAGAGTVGQGTSSERLLSLGALQPYLIANGEFWRLFSAMFLHLNLFHILFNAWALWVFGTMVERDFGTGRFLAIFFVSGFLASVTSYAFGPTVVIGVGASGAIFGVFGAFVEYNYRRRHLALAAANLRFAMTLILINALLALAWGTIDWRAHLGGFVAGLAAGFVADSGGSKKQPAGVTALGYVGLVALGVALVVWRTAVIRGLPEFEQAVRFFSSLTG